MPHTSRNTKRTLEEIAMAEDSEDDDYDDSVPGPSKSRNRRSRQHSKPARKRQRRGYRGSDVDSDDEELLSDDNELSYSDESEDEEVETNERGRPIRKTTRKSVTYQESESDEDELGQFELDDNSEDSDRPARKPQQHLVVKLSVPNIGSIQSTRTLRKRSGSHSSNKPLDTVTGGLRRSRRVSHDEDEPVVALTNSGNHVEIVRAGSRDPEGIPSRAFKGGKGIKHPSKSTIDEESEATQTKEEENDELEIKASQQDLLDNDDKTQIVEEAELIATVSDNGDNNEDMTENVEPAAYPTAYDEAQDNHMEEEEDDDDDDEGPVRRSRSSRIAALQQEDPIAADSPGSQTRGRSLRSGKRRAQDESSDFDPENEVEPGDDLSSSSESNQSPQKEDEDESSNNGRRSTRLRGNARSRQRSPLTDEDDELAAEVEELKRDGKRKRSLREELFLEPRGRRGGKKPNYNLLKNLVPIEDDEDDGPAPSPSQRTRKPGAGSWQRSLFSTYGPFGGAGGPIPLLGGVPGQRAQGDVDSDSSDEDVMKQPKQVGGLVGMTPTTAGGFNLFPQTLNTDPQQAAAGTPANLGKIKDRQALADADPLGVDQNVNFDSVGGLENHINQLKEMVALPLLYPEIFMRFKITPPRGVLFHGPPGTGKTLLARALASSVSSQGRKVTFYMRKGADALSKWVGEAERQLRLLFEEARKNQPSIIFFDEIDGLAPVRSSKQEQIHASIVSTLLALMDGMDGRGQVIVIGATNRPDSIDPALRRPGRFDREFYFPLPGTEARRAILDIHTRGWNPPLDPAVKQELAELTKGYGGADLRALCTEAALNAVQRRYPQIYTSTEKLLIDPTTIEVTPKDFMISIKKMVPSSERSTSSGASPLPPVIAPLLRKSLAEIKDLLAEIMPQKKNLTALEEARYEDVADGRGFGKERMQQTFESARVFRPRLLIHGKFGMGQQYLASAMLNHFEGLHVQSFDLPTLLGDTSSTPEAQVVRLFAEVKMHKPSVIYIPNVLEWYHTVSSSVISTFLGLLRSIKPTDPILVLGILEHDEPQVDPNIARDLFGFSKKNQFHLQEPSHDQRLEYFLPLKDYIRTSPDDFPDPANRKKRTLEILPPAPPMPEKGPPPLSKEEQKAQKKRDRQTLNLLKIRLQPIMDQIRTRHKKFRTGVIDESQIRYLFDSADPGTVRSDLPTDMLAQAAFRPFEIGTDAHGVPGLVDQSNGKFYYNLDSVTIEKRLSNGYYKRPKDYLADIKRLAKDAKQIGDEDRLLKANELLANVEVDIGGIEYGEPALAAECERVYQRELAREKEMIENARSGKEPSKDMPPPQLILNVPHAGSGPSTSTQTEGPINLGEPTHRDRDILNLVTPATPSRTTSYPTTLTNGAYMSGGRFDSIITNGSSSHNEGHLADDEGDTHMGGTDSHPGSHERSNETQKTTSSSFDSREAAQPRPFHSYTAPSQELRKASGMSAPLNQTGAFTPMAAGSQAADYQNDASTTQTSNEKKNSGPSEREHGDTQDSGPNLYLYDERRSAGGSEIPDTQGEPQSSQTPAHSQQQPQNSSSRGTDGAAQSNTSVPVPRSNGHLQDLLNPSPQPNLIQVEETKLNNFHQDVAFKTTGLGVEQLEQVNSVLMDTIWKTRGEWNRGTVLDKVAHAFNATMVDMQEAGQEFGPASWENERRQ